MSQLRLGSFLRFLAVGGSATLLHYLIMFLALRSGLATPGPASALGYSLSTLYNYWANAHFTFEGKHDHTRSFPRFLATALVGLGINQLILLTLIHLGVPVPVAQLLATGTVLVWNYTINAIWSFRLRHPS